MRIAYYTYKNHPEMRKYVIDNSYDSYYKTINILVPDDYDYVEYYEVSVLGENVKKISDKTYMIRMPYASDYADYMAFVSSRLIQKEEFFDRFKFVFRVKYTFTLKCDELDKSFEITADEMYKIFFNVQLSEQQYPKIHIPKFKEPLKNVVVLEELRDD